MGGHVVPMPTVHVVSMPVAVLGPAASHPGWVSWCGQQLRVGLGAGLVGHGVSLGCVPWLIL